MMQTHEESRFLNIGCGVDVSIRDLAELIRGIVGFEGDIIFDTSKPDGTPRKLLDVSRLQAYGWSQTIPLKEGITSIYVQYVQSLRAR